MIISQQAGKKKEKRSWHKARPIRCIKRNLVLKSGSNFQLQSFIHRANQYWGTKKLKKLGSLHQDTSASEVAQRPFKSVLPWIFCHYDLSMTNNLRQDPSFYCFLGYSSLTQIFGLLSMCDAQIAVKDSTKTRKQFQYFTRGRWVMKKLIILHGKIYYWVKSDFILDVKMGKNKK